MILRTSLVALGVLLTSCGVSVSSNSGEEKPYRCFEGVNLQQMVAAESPPQPGHTWHSDQTAYKDQFFDDQQVADLPLAPSSPFVDHLCQRLRNQLDGRCEEKQFWTSAEACAGLFESPAKAITAPDGTYKLRPVKGRVVLILSKAPNGSSKVVLTTTEWEG
jgi:hypothetical protein